MGAMGNTDTNAVATQRHKIEAPARADTEVVELASILETDEGRTIIHHDVVAKIAGMAIREVEGVHSLAPFGAGQVLTRLTRQVSGKQMRNLGVQVGWEGRSRRRCAHRRQVRPQHHRDGARDPHGREGARRRDDGAQGRRD